MGKCRFMPLLPVISPPRPEYIASTTCTGKEILMTVHAAKPMLRSLLLSYALSALLLSGLAFCLYRLRLKEGQVNLMVFAIYLIACFAGGLAAGKGIRKRRFFWGFLLGLLYFLVLFAVSWALNQGGPVDLERSATVLGLCVLGGSLGGMVS